jgi:hypothetical protein
MPAGPAMPSSPRASPSRSARRWPLPLRHPVAATLIWAGVLLSVFVPLSVRRLCRANR